MILLTEADARPEAERQRVDEIKDVGSRAVPSAHGEPTRGAVACDEKEGVAKGAQGQNVPATAPPPRSTHASATCADDGRTFVTEHSGEHREAAR